MWGDSKLVDLEIDDSNTAIHHVFEMRRGMNEFDHRSFFSFYLPHRMASGSPLVSACCFSFLR